MRKKTPKIMAPRHLLEEMMERQIMIKAEHIKQLTRVKPKNKA